MTRLSPVLAGVALALCSQFAAAQADTAPSGAVPPNNPAYVDQSRLNQTKDPYIKKRVAVKRAKKEYKAEKSDAKSDYKARKKAAKAQYKAAKKDAKTERKEELEQGGR